MRSIELNKDYIFDPVKFSNLCVNISNDWQNKIIKDTFTILGEDFRLWDVADIRFYAVLRSSEFNGKPTNIFHLTLDVNHLLFSSIGNDFELSIPLVKEVCVRELISESFYNYFNDKHGLKYSVLFIDKVKSIKSILNSLSILFKGNNDIFKNIDKSILWIGNTLDLSDFNFYHFGVNFGINRDSTPYLSLISDDIKISFIPNEINIIQTKQFTDSLTTVDHKHLFKNITDIELATVIKNHILRCFNKIYDNDFVDLHDLFNVLDMENY